MKILKSEFYKLKHTWIPWAHFILPVLYALIFYGAATFTSLKNFSDMDIILNYFVLLGAILPIIFGAITSKVVDMEASAGRFQVILSTTKSRSKAYGGKLIMLLLSFLFSISLAVFIFAMLFGNQATMAWLIELLFSFYRMFIYIYDSFVGINYVRWWCIYWIGICRNIDCFTFNNQFR